MEEVLQIIDANLGQVGEVLPYYLEMLDPEDVTWVRNLVRLAFVQGYGTGLHAQPGDGLDLPLAASTLWVTLNPR